MNNFQNPSGFVRFGRVGTGGLGLLLLVPGLALILFALAILISAWIGKPLARVFLNTFLGHRTSSTCYQSTG